MFLTVLYRFASLRSVCFKPGRTVCSRFVVSVFELSINLDGFAINILKYKKKDEKRIFVLLQDTIECLLLLMMSSRV